MMHDLAKMFLHCLNHWNFETPSTKKADASTEEDASEMTAYTTNYTRSVLLLFATYQLLTMQNP